MNVPGSESIVILNHVMGEIESHTCIKFVHWKEQTNNPPNVYLLFTYGENRWMAWLPCKYPLIDINLKIIVNLHTQETVFLAFLIVEL